MGIVLVDREGRIGDMNGAACRMLQVKRENCVGEPAAKVLPAEGIVLEVIEKTLRDGRPVADLAGSPIDDDGDCTVRCRSTILRDGDSKMIGAACHFDDISDLSKMEKEVKHLDSLAMMGRFASTIAHEIRNPLMGIFAGVQFLQKTIDLSTPEQETTFTIICDEVDRLNRIVSDLLGAAKPPELCYESVDPNEICRKVSIIAREDALQRKVELSLDCDPALPPIQLDPDLASQVLLNLVRNALQASPPGGKVTLKTGLSPVSPRLGMLPSGSAPPAMEFRVIDEGPGVPEGKAEQIFEPFQSSKKSGTGLGLYISFQIMERHGGALWAVTETKKGATFIARFPYGTPETECESRAVREETGK